MDAPNFLQPLGTAIRNDDARRAIGAARFVHQMPGERDRRTAGPHREDFRSRALEMALGKKAVERKAGGDRVLGVADELSGALRQAARLAHEPCVRIDRVELVPTGAIEVDLVRRDERAE